MKLLVWIETSTTTPGRLSEQEMQNIGTSLCAWAGLADAAIVTVGGLRAYDELKPVVLQSPLPVIPSIKVSQITTRYSLESQALWSHLAAEVRRVATLTSRRETLLELESALSPYLASTGPSPERLRDGLAQISPHVDVWWYPAIDESPERRDRFLELGRVIADYVRFVDSGRYWSHRVSVSPQMIAACRMLEEISTRRPVRVAYVGVGRNHPYWTVSQLRQSLPLIAKTEEMLIVYPGRDAADDVGTQLRGARLVPYA